MKNNKLVFYKALAGVLLASSIVLVSNNKSNNQTKEISIEKEFEKCYSNTFVIKNGTIIYYDENGENNINNFPKIDYSKDYSVIEIDKDGNEKNTTYTGSQFSKIIALYWGDAAMEYLPSEFPIYEYMANSTNNLEKKELKYRI